MRRLVDVISQRMRTLPLRGLERDGFVSRTVYPTVSPRVDDDLTPLGHSLREPIPRFGERVFAHRAAVEAARIAFHTRAQPSATLVHRIADAGR